MAYLHTRIVYLLSVLGTAILVLLLAEIYDLRLTSRSKDGSQDLRSKDGSQDLSPKKVNQYKMKAGELVYIEMGSNTGEWSKDKFSELRRQGKTFYCYMFEVQPKHLQGSLKAIAEEFSCELIPRAVWNADGQQKKFTVHELDVAASLFAGSMFESKADKQIDVVTIDIVRWLKETINPEAYIHARMDIEGAEYVVIRQLITSGIACMFDVLELEGHALHHKGHYPMMPVDVVIPWILADCGVHVRFEAFENWTVVTEALGGDTSCEKCPYLRQGPLLSVPASL